MVAARPFAGSRWRSARWLVLAPHADDETLGAGALVAETASEGRLARLVFLTDGTGSHSHPDPASRARLKAIRRAEARRACRILAGHRCDPPIFLDWPDAHPFGRESDAYRKTVRQLASLCRREQVDAIAVTPPDEPHCDHAAAGRLAADVARAALRPVMVFDYLVWGGSPPSRHAFLTRPISKGRRQAALSAHRSQLTPLFGPGFRLPSQMGAMPDQDRLYARSRHAAP